MISYIKGKVDQVSEGSCVVECAQMGYEISMPASSLGRISAGQEVCVYTVMSVREDGISLFGFLTKAERIMFNMLTGVSGIGPKAALGILSSIGVDELRLAIAAEDFKLIASAKGIGTKTAQKIVLELKGKLEKEFGREAFADIAPVSGTDISGGAIGSAIDVLEALGFSRTSAVRAVNSVENAGELSSSEIVNEALKVIE